jgi:hypothetical protein
MRVTIIKDDNTVGVDGEFYTVDCSTLPADFHALQWQTVRGEVEYRMTRCEHCSARSKKGNVDITDMAPYQPYVDAWHVAKTAADAEKAKQAEATAAQKAAKANAA